VCGSLATTKINDKEKNKEKNKDKTRIGCPTFFSGTHTTVHSIGKVGDPSL
jgi:hypothetical protein